ncbi:MAG: hypothetical protein JWO05_3732 [Gemmatimonadetes bacterium]|nr:hypothetical protein [Gemmatimonadota bacterium]
MALIVVLALGGAGAYWNFVYSPQEITLDALEQHVDSLEQRNAQTQADVKRGTAASFKVQAEALSHDLALMRQLVPSENEVPVLLEQVSTAARRAGLDLSDVAPDVNQIGDNFDAQRYKIGVTGSYHNIAAFLTNVGSLQRIVAPMNLALLPTSRNVPVNQKNKFVAILDAKLQIQTYVSHAPGQSKLPPPVEKKP